MSLVNLGKSTIKQVPARANIADYSGAYGAAALGSRLRRVSERIDREATAVYQRAGLRFEQRWMAVTSLLIECGEMSVSEIAQALRITQPSVSQTLCSLHAAGFAAEKADPQDARRRIQFLTKAGMGFVDQVKEIWESLKITARELDREAGDVISSLDRLENALDRVSLSERALRHLAASPSKARAGRRRRSSLTA
jgi:DNA-binding MarR family transcriptional regulator